MEPTPATSSVQADTRFFGHPRGLATLFFTEMWERYSYYGTRALLILYMTAATTTGGLGFSVMKSGAIYGFYTAMVYLLSLPGGWVADRIIGQQRRLNEIACYVQELHNELEEMRKSLLPTLTASEKR